MNTNILDEFNRLIAFIQEEIETRDCDPATRHRVDQAPSS
jgi:hypothetical protein